MIEILVVVFILAAVMGMVTLRLTRDDRDLVRDEADRLVVVLQTARDEAILRGNVFLFELDDEGYRFLQPNGKNELVPVGDGPLAPRRLPPGVQMGLEVDGQSREGRQGIVLDPSGALVAFNIVFDLNEARWWVLGQDGKIRSLPTPDAQPS